VPSGERPSIVVIFFPATVCSGVLQERIASPFASTVHEPQKPRPHPNLVPAIPTSSRKTHKSGVSGGEETMCALPLIVRFVGMARILSVKNALGVPFLVTNCVRRRRHPSPKACRRRRHGSIG